MGNSILFYNKPSNASLSRLRLQADEAAFSHLIRAARYLGHKTISGATSEIFADRKLSFDPGLVIPFGRTRFSNAIINDYVFEYLNRSTDLPILHNLSDRTNNSAFGVEKRKDIPLLNYLFNSSVPIATVGACSKCSNEQLFEFGFSWWLRDHAISGVACCVRHGLMLEQFEFTAVFEGVGLLPHEVLKNRHEPSSGHPYLLEFSVSSLISMSWSKAINPDFVIDAAFRSIENDGGNDRLAIRHIFSEKFLEKIPKCDIASFLGADKLSLETQMNSLFNGHLTSWKIAIHVAISFFGSIDKAIQFNCEMIQTDTSKLMERKLRRKIYGSNSLITIA